MILPRDRKIAGFLIKIKLWKYERSKGIWQQPMIFPCWGTHWLFNRMLKRQTRDGWHHAPACVGNEWSGAHLVTLSCTCGAAKHKIK